MTIGDMYLLDEPYIPPTIDTSLIQIKSKPDLAKLGGGEEFYRVSIGDNYRPTVKGPYFFHSIDFRVSPKDPDAGPREYLIAIEYVRQTSGKQIKRYHWLPTCHLFKKPYQGIFTNKKSLEEFMTHVDYCYDSDPKWTSWLHRYKADKDKKSSYYRNMRQIRDL